MVRYQYVAEVSPPAPFVHVTIQNTEKPELISSELPALLDSGADRTVIPGTLVSALGLASLRKIPIGGLGMKTQELDSYSVFVQVRHQKSIEVEVVAHANEATVLLGRDVLNHLRIVLDGPNKILEIG